MMALKCDNCGGYFDFDFSKDNVITTLRMFYKDTAGIAYQIKPDKDLCPACLAAVAKALEDRKRRTVDPMEDDLK